MSGLASGISAVGGFHGRLTWHHRRPAAKSGVKGTGPSPIAGQWGCGGRGGQGDMFPAATFRALSSLRQTSLLATRRYNRIAATCHSSSSTKCASYTVPYVYRGLSKDGGSCSCTSLRNATCPQFTLQKLSVPYATFSEGLRGRPHRDIPRRSRLSFSGPGHLSVSQSGSRP